jgi:hypothetical protein
MRRRILLTAGSLGFVVCIFEFRCLVSPFSCSVALRSWPGASDWSRK